MTSPAKQGSSRWGFLSQAVGGLESRLDILLAEGQEGQANKPTPAAGNTSAAKPETAISRSASNSSSRTNDRLQERLARAVAAKNAQKAGAQSTSSNVPSRTGSPITVGESPRQSLDATSNLGGDEATKRVSQDLGSTTIANTIESDTPTIPTVEVQSSTPIVEPTPETTTEPQQASPNAVVTLKAEPTSRLSTDSTTSSIPRESLDSIPQNDTTTSSSLDEPPTTTPVTDAVPTSKSPAQLEAALSQLQSDYETSELQRQEEVHGYIERIDALQAKLKYLAKESLESASNAKNAAPSGSLEKKLAEKEQQIILLMEEGQALSKKELTHMTTIKKLRAKILEDNKEVAEIKKKQEKAGKEAASLAERLKRAEGAEKSLSERNNVINRLRKELDAVKIERDTKDTVIANLKAQLENDAAEEKEAEAKVANETLQAEKKRVAELEDDISNLKIEKQLVSDRAQIQIKELREKMDREAEDARIAALEMKNEQQMLESKLEMMRARAEEVSTGATGDAQAKLLRQIETLQTQYAVASENWQGIEASLTARAISLEKERDEATKREADVRRKAREVTLKAKRNEDELEETRSKLPNFQQELSQRTAQLDDLKKRVEEAESALVSAKAEFEDEKQTWNSEMQQRLLEEKQKWLEEVSLNGRGESPVASSRRGLTSEYLGLQNMQSRRPSARSTTGDLVTSERFVGRRQSGQPTSKSPDPGTPVRHDSTASLTHSFSLNSIATNGTGGSEFKPQTPSLHTLDHDDFFDTHRSSSPQQTIHDIISTSTAGAGPTVQLVERMSSAVRKLESEKVATKEEVARLIAQRDEARTEIVALMKEVEVKRGLEEKVEALEEEIKGIKERYEVTLELLGEKSEEVNELRGDVEDIKAMYKELVIKSVG
ncbi:putative m protein repeat protein [Botrytis fragariae]|uniref:Putative m protein repeat protein n=1 Tax=Botrytis fragariae TaxID=1964551 RepID=A0A8H6AG13_9HELO|nr:putative m protein repeat protein [Botrytis fragariae]KAF5867698.1 putative m protein repeat protein [Botrytis fragariae]